MVNIMELCYINARELCSLSEAKEILSHKIDKTEYDNTEMPTVSLVNKMNENDIEIIDLLQNGGNIENLQRAVELLGNSKTDFFHQTMVLIIKEYIEHVLMDKIDDEGNRLLDLLRSDTDIEKLRQSVDSMGNVTGNSLQTTVLSVIKEYIKK